MNERQESEWLYAKGLELAILIKGPPSNLGELKKDWQVHLMIDNYHSLAVNIAKRIIDSAEKLKYKDET